MKWKYLFFFWDSKLLNYTSSFKTPLTLSGYLINLKNVKNIKGKSVLKQV